MLSSVAAGTLQAYAMLILINVSHHHLTQSSSDFGPVSQCSSEAYNTTMKEGACAPKYVSIQVPEHPDSNFLTDIVPRYVVVRRCLGLCPSQNNQDENFQCHPTEFGIRKQSFGVILKYLNGSEYCTNINEDDHTSCACQCVEEKCENKMIFDKRTCRCKCSPEERTLCRKNQLKTWDNNKCLCKCKKPIECSTGFVFSEITCKCGAPRMGSFEIGQMNTSSVLVSSDNTLTILFGVLAVVFFIVMVVFISLWRVEVKKRKSKPSENPGESEPMMHLSKGTPEVRCDDS